MTYEHRLLDRALPLSCGCVVWLGHQSKDGYGIMRIGSRTDGTRKLERTHRLMWKLACGSVPRNKQVLHRCDVPACINPDHLFLGTNADNVSDKVRKGRARGMPGEQHPRVRLTDADVHQIRQLFKAGAHRQHIADRFGISRNYANKLILGRHTIR
jgi:hypothetical protein